MHELLGGVQKLVLVGIGLFPFEWACSEMLYRMVLPPVVK
jgi:hypothetical protein